MKKITYSNEKFYFLTDDEFFEAKKVWAEGVHHWCVRLQTDMTNPYKFAETPRTDLDCEEIFIISVDQYGIPRKVYKRGGFYYWGVGGDDDGCRYVKFTPTEQELASLVNQEEFYRQKKYLT